MVEYNRGTKIKECDIMEVRVSHSLISSSTMKFYSYMVKEEEEEEELMPSQEARVNRVFIRITSSYMTFLFIKPTPMKNRHKSMH